MAAIDRECSFRRVSIVLGYPGVVDSDLVRYFPERTTLPACLDYPLGLEELRKRVPEHPALHKWRMPAMVVVDEDVRQRALVCIKTAKALTLQQQLVGGGAVKQQDKDTLVPLCSPGYIFTVKENRLVSITELSTGYSSDPQVVGSALVLHHNRS